jgi:hypothetical protein
MGIVSFSLWGNNDVYNLGMLENALMIPKLYPDFKVWIYIGNTVQKKILKVLQKMKHVRIIKKNEDDSMANSLWRFEPAFITDEIVLVRDADSRISKRETLAVSEWLASDSDFHIMRDHPTGHSFKIMAGMWGCRNGILKSLVDKYRTFAPYNCLGIDQHFLAEFIYASVVEKAYIHDNYFKYETNIHSFTETDETSFVGEIILEAPLAIEYLKLKPEEYLDLVKYSSDGF